MRAWLLVIVLTVAALIAALAWLLLRDQASTVAVESVPSAAEASALREQRTGAEDIESHPVRELEQTPAESRSDKKTETSPSTTEDVMGRTVVAYGAVMVPLELDPAKVEVRLLDCDDQKLDAVSLDSRGGFELRHHASLANGWRVCAAPLNGGPFSVASDGPFSRHALADRPQECRLRIMDAGLVRGTVYAESDRRPLPGIKITACSLLRGFLHASVEVHSDARGDFVLRPSGLPPDELVLVSEHPEWLPTASSPILVSPGRETESLRILLKPRRGLHGRLIDHGLASISDAQISLRSGLASFHGRTTSISTDENGNFEFAEIPIPLRGAYLHVEGGSTYGPVLQPLGENDQDLTVYAGPPIVATGNVWSSVDRAPIGQSTISVHPSMQSDDSSAFDSRDLAGDFDRCGTDTNGAFLVTLCTAHPDHAWVTVEAEGFRRFDAEFSKVFARESEPGKYHAEISLDPDR